MSSMSSENFFRTREEELARLNTELGDVKELMRDISSRVSQIERHVKRAFAVPESTKPALAKPKGVGPDRPSISPEQALEFFRELTDLSRENGSAAIEERLEGMSIADLKLMAHELGVSFSSKPTRRSLHAGIRGRVSESVMLSRNRNVTAPAADQSNVRESQPGKDQPD